MWETLRQVLKDSTFYYKKLFFFVVILFIFGGGYLTYIQTSPFAPQASTTLPSNLSPSDGANNYSYAVTIAENGKVTVNNQTVRGALRFESDKTVFLLVVVRSAPNYIETIQADVRLPKPFTLVGDVDPRFYTIHGVGSSNFVATSNQSIRFTAYDIFPEAEVSIRLSFPSSYFSISFIDRLRSQLTALPAEDWLALGIVLPGLTLIFLGYLLFSKWFSLFRIRRGSPRPKPPTALAPSIVGALYHGHIGSREITATLVDLAGRGFLSMHHSEGSRLSFVKGSNLFTSEANVLQPFEIFLLHQIFGDQGALAPSDQVETILDRELFSTRVAQAMVNIYDATVAEGYFIVSPNRYYLRYKVTGIIMFFVGLLALVYGSFTLTEPAYVLFFWAGMIGAALLIIWLTPGLPHRTKAGDAAVADWLGFRAYLTDPRAVVSVNTDEFFRYLPYAIVMSCEKEWINRWRATTLVLPSWFSATITPYTAEDYQVTLLWVINLLTRELFNARTPDLA